MTLPGVQFQTVDGRLGVASSGTGRPMVLIGAADSGDVDLPTSLTRPAQALAIFEAGPLVEYALPALALGVPVVAIRAVADAVGSCSAVSNAYMAGSSDGSIHAGAAPNASYSIKVKFTLGGSVGTGPITWIVSSDGGDTWSEPASITTNKYLTLPVRFGTIRVDLSDGTVTTNDYLTFTTSVTAAGTIGSVDSSEMHGWAPGDITTGGTVNDAYDLRVEIVTGGTVGVAGITYRCSRDGGRTGMGPTYTLGAASTITVPDSGGVVFTLHMTTLYSGDAWACVTTAPGISNGSLSTALATLHAYSGDWEVLSVAGPVSASDFDTVDAALETLTNTYDKDRIAVLSWRIPTADESDAAYQAAFVAAMGAKASSTGLTSVGAGSVKVTSNGLNQRRCVTFDVAPKIASVGAAINPAQIDYPGGPLLGASLRDAAGNADCHDEALNLGLDAARAITLRSWEGLAGVYITWARTFAAEGSDFTNITNRRIVNIARTTARAYLRRQIAKGLVVDRTSGFLKAVEVDRLNRNGTAALRTALKGACSDVSLVVATDDNLLAEGAEMHADVAVIPLAYPKTIVCTIGLKNPVNV